MDVLSDKMMQTSLHDRVDLAAQPSVTEPLPPRLGPIPPPHAVRHRRRSVSPHRSDDDDNVEDNRVYGEPGSGSEPSRRGPYFFPPLWLARRTACVQRLRAENVRTVADLGCGKGAVLSMLAQPAWHKDDFPELYPLAPDEVALESESGEDDARPGPKRTAANTSDSAAQPEHAVNQSRRDKLAVLRKVPRGRPQENELHLSRIIGVDLDRNECEAAVRVVKSTADADAASSLAAPERWEDARVEVYEGGVETFNEALQGVDAIILTEVVEHLSPAALAKLPHVLFSLYAPRLVIITTPNHAFNAYFPAPAPPPNRNGKSAQLGEEDGAHLFPDPTGRTNRVFRDATHMLEWTPEDFRAWCDGLLETHASDYTVSISGVGSLAAYWAPHGDLPFPPPSLAVHPALADHPACVALPAQPDRFFATQIAVFERQYSCEPERSSRSARPTPLPFFSPSSAPAPLPEAPPGVAGSSSNALLPSQTDGGPAALVPAAAKPAHELVCAVTLRAYPSTRERPASLAVVREVIEAVFLSEGNRAELSLADLWRIGGDAEIGLRAIAQGQVGRVVDALVGSPTAVPDVSVASSLGDNLSDESARPETEGQQTVDVDDDDNAGEGEEGTGAGPDEFVLSVDTTQRGMKALRIRWLGYEESFRTFRAALRVVRQDPTLVDPGAAAAGTTTLEKEEEDVPEEGGDEGVLALDERPLDEPVGAEGRPTTMTAPTWDRAPTFGPAPPPSMDTWTRSLTSEAVTDTTPAGQGQVVASWDEDDW